MNYIFQTIVDKGHGNCMQAAVASLFSVMLEDVPNFIEYKDGWFRPLYEFTSKYGYEYDGMLHNKNHSSLMNPTHDCFNEAKWSKRHMITKRKLYKEEGVDGFFLASVLSPKYFNWQTGMTATHAVIIDRDYNIVHDPNINYRKILKYPLADVLGYNGIIDVFLLNPISD